MISKQKKKRLLFTEAELLKGLIAKKAHADEVIDICPESFLEVECLLEYNPQIEMELSMPTN